MRAPFADYNSPVVAVSMADRGIKAAPAVLDRAGVPADDVGTVITGNMTQSSFDAYVLPLCCRAMSACIPACRSKG